MLFGEGRQMKSPSGVEIGYIVGPSTTGIRTMGSLTEKSDYNNISPQKTAPQTTAIDYPQTLVNQNNFASLRSTHISPRTSLTAGSFEANNEQLDKLGNCPGVKCLDDLRSTSPGRSPGAGHSFLANQKTKSPDQITKNPKGESTLSDSGDDYRRTSPGRSPGAGHALEDANGESNPKSTELQTTFPSSSQAHQSFFTYSAESRKNSPRPPSLPATVLATSQKNTDTAGHCLGKKCTYNFPTASPSDSHEVRKSDNITPEHDGAHFGVVQSHAGQIDDYRPTTPGHSQGAGNVIVKEDRTAP